MTNQKPKVTHVQNKEERSQLRGILVNFFDKMIREESFLSTSIAKGGVLAGINWKSQAPEDLLAQRKLLSSYIKSGMLERKDEELEIALIAAVVWTNRTLEKEMHDRVLGLW